MCGRSPRTKLRDEPESCLFPEVVFEEIINVSFLACERP